MIDYDGHTSDTHEIVQSRRVFNLTVWSSTHYFWMHKYGWVKTLYNVLQQPLQLRYFRVGSTAMNRQMMFDFWRILFWKRLNTMQIECRNTVDFYWQRINVVNNFKMNGTLYIISPLFNSNQCMSRKRFLLNDKTSTFCNTWRQSSCAGLSAGSKQLKHLCSAYKSSYQ